MKTFLIVLFRFKVCRNQTIIIKYTYRVANFQLKNVKNLMAGNQKLLKKKTILSMYLLAMSVS